MGTQRDRPSRQTDPNKLRAFLRTWLGKKPSFRSFNEAIQKRLEEGEISRSAVYRVFIGQPIVQITWETVEKVLGIPFETIEWAEIQFKSQWEFFHPASYVGKVWLEVVANPENLDRAHRFTILWGFWQYCDLLSFEDLERASLTHMKGPDGQSFPIFFEISPPCHVVCGQGDPPAGRVH
ncbi:MAG TPA: hypothetical protein VE988_05160, partial [Gemmataceae bacterium]|nr:hypothetical protein [Gemmataceae bacterium]